MTENANPGMNNRQQTRARERIASSVREDPDTDCWTWVRQVSNSGYGRIMLRDQDGTYMESAHRTSYSIFVGPIPEHGVIRQSCGNRLCVNPENLLLTIEER